LKMSAGYTEGARRVIFTARAQAIRYGSLCIESEHILLAILDEGKAEAGHLFGEGTFVEALRKEIETHLAIHAPISGAVDIPLSTESKQILKLAFEEADELGHRQVSFEHILLGILQVESCVSAMILYMHGATIPTMRTEAIRAAKEIQ
jgi:ATP-dependent Clp protease ATP-binding subunit ClpA